MFQEPSHAPAHSATAERDVFSALRTLLVGTRAAIDELPPLPDLVAGVIALASGTRRKVILPLARVPVELALVRRGGNVVIDCYGTESVPEVLIRERVVRLRELLEITTDACSALGERGEGVTAHAMARLARRVEQTPIRPDPHEGLCAVECSGGTRESPGASTALAFGFSARIAPSVDPGRDALAFDDVHAMLFHGVLWGFSGSRRFQLFEGAILLAAQRMVAAVRALVDAWQTDRPVHVRLCFDRFAVTVRRQRDGQVWLTLRAGNGESLTLPALDVPGVALPILRLASDVVRKLIAVDRRQSHNLRVAELRTEVRTLRRTVRGRHRLDSFENRDPERLRLSSPEPVRAEASVLAPRPGRLRYTERWSAEVDGLDAGSIFLCGDRMVVASQKLTLALSRSDGEVLWSQPTARAQTHMVSRRLVRVLPDGEVELCEVETGSVVSRTRIAARPGAGAEATFAGGGELPPVAILGEGRKCVVALDLRTGQPRWRYRTRGASPQLRRAGRVVLVTSGDGAVDAVDAASGDVVWRFGDRVRFCLPPAVGRDVAIAVSGEPGGGAGAAYGIELYTGRLLWRADLPKAPSHAPVFAGDTVVVPCDRGRNACLCSLDPTDGALRWTVADPGLDNAAQALAVDDALIVNTPSGRVVCIELSTGATRWTRALANPLTDDVPRNLAPVLRQGALFVPSAQVHVLRPKDGETLTDVECDLVPDFLHVDERGWFYVGEESGHLRSFAAAPQLALVR